MIKTINLEFVSTVDEDFGGYWSIKADTNLSDDELKVIALQEMIKQESTLNADSIEFTYIER